MATVGIEGAGKTTLLLQLQELLCCRRSSHPAFVSELFPDLACMVVPMATFGQSSATNADDESDTVHTIEARTVGRFWNDLIGTPVHLGSPPETTFEEFCARIRRAVAAHRRRRQVDEEDIEKRVGILLCVDEIIKKLSPTSATMA